MHGRNDAGLALEGPRKKKNDTELQQHSYKNTYNQTDQEGNFVQMPNVDGGVIVIFNVKDFAITQNAVNRRAST